VRTVVETVSFYADIGDLQSAAIMVLVFYEHISQLQQYTQLISRILCSYIELLRKL